MKYKELVLHFHGADEASCISDVDAVLAAVAAACGLREENSGRQLLRRTGGSDDDVVWEVRVFGTITRTLVRQLAKKIHPFIRGYVVIFGVDNDREKQIRGDTIAHYVPWDWEVGDT